MEMSYAQAYASFSQDQPLPEEVTRIGAPDDLPKLVRDRGFGFFRPESTVHDLGEISLRRGLKQNAEIFHLETPIGYLDHQLGVYLIPKNLETDLASVPQLFTWLVPKTGTHLPAAIVHDAFTPPPDHTWFGPEIDQQNADRIFREAMGTLGTGWIRRWLVWTAVAFATETKSVPTRFKESHIAGIWTAFRLAMLFVVIPLLGIMATLDLFDVSVILPWMGDRPTSYELASGALFAVLIPVVVCALLFWRSHLRWAALLLGIAIAALLHATLASLGLLLVYTALETSIDARAKRSDGRAAGRSWATLVLATLGLAGLVRVALWIADWIGPGWKWDIPGVQALALFLSDRAQQLWLLPGWVVAMLLAIMAVLFVKLKPQTSNKTPTPAGRTTSRR